MEEFQASKNVRDGCAAVKGAGLAGSGSEVVERFDDAGGAGARA